MGCRRDAGYRYPQGPPQPAPVMARGRGHSIDDRARPGSAWGPAAFSRGQGHERPASVPFSRGQGQDRSGSVPHGRGFQQGRASPAPSRVDNLPHGAASGAGPAAGAPYRASSRGRVRTPERSQRSSGGRDGSRDSHRGSHREHSRDTAQRQHSSSSRPSRAASGATGHSPMRSSGAIHNGPSKDSAQSPTIPS